jgi:hypothetical protein
MGCPMAVGRSNQQGIYNWQQGLENRAVQRMLHSGTIHTKLTINEPGDRYEQEADQLAVR